MGKKYLKNWKHNSISNFKFIFLKAVSLSNFKILIKKVSLKSFDHCYIFDLIFMTVLFGNHWKYRNVSTHLLALFFSIVKNNVNIFNNLIYVLLCNNNYIIYLCMSFLDHV